MVKLLATAGLSAGYFAVAFLAAHPRVDAEYRSHYLDHTAVCWVPRMLRAGDSAMTPPASLQVAQLTYPAACRTLRLGWYDLEDWGVWSRVPDAILRLPRRPGAREVGLTFRTAPAPNPAVRVRLALNGETVEAEIEPGTTKTVFLPLPPEGAPHDPDLRLHFLGHATVPDPWRETATREVGLGLVAIRYLPADGATAQDPRRAIQ